MKKIIVILNALWCFFLVGCIEKQVNKEPNELLQYKEEIKKEITNCYELLDINDYSEDNWNAIKEIYHGSNDLINNQNDKEELFVEKNRIICKMRSISPKSLTNDYLQKSFDLEDKKLYWEGSVDDDFSDDLIIVVLKRPINYIELDVECFGLKNAVSIKYVNEVIPPDYMFKSEYRYLLDNYRHIIDISLKPSGKEKVIETIKILEQLEFVKSAQPDIAIEVE